MLTGWKCTKFEYKIQNDTLITETEGSFNEANGKIQFKITADGKLDVNYQFIVKKDINPRQFGMAFYLPQEINTLSWKRKGIWTGYPDDHIGREAGTATAETKQIRRNIWEKPSCSWKDDFRPLGNIDFCSTKSCITEASLQSQDGAGIHIQSDGKHSVRAFKEDDKIGFLIADFNTGGGDLFFAGHHKTEDRPLKSGDSMKGNFVISIK